MTIDDYDLIDKDINEFIRRGREAFEWEAKNARDDKTSSSTNDL